MGEIFKTLGAAIVVIAVLTAIVSTLTGCASTVSQIKADSAGITAK